MVRSGQKSKGEEPMSTSSSPHRCVIVSNWGSFGQIASSQIRSTSSKVSGRCSSAPAGTPEITDRRACRTGKVVYGIVPAR
jgi:hypothetical protein